MPELSELIHSSIVRDMSEGVMTIGLDGVITSLNPAASRILDRQSEELVGCSFAPSFIEYPENDGFNQAVLDAVYEPDAPHESIVPYFTGEVMRQLRMTTSYLRDGEHKAGVIAVLEDISELAELRDAMLAMERIKALNYQLELRNRLLSETFGRFLSDEIVHQLLDTPDGLEMGGQKLSITVLMSDLRGFTALSERLGEMTEIIERRGGTIIEFVGDGILTIFGAPARSDTHAADAVAAAVEMQARMEEVNRWNLSQGYPVLEMGIGVHTGDTIVGNVGSEQRTRYNVIGNTVNLCGRIESYTVGGQVLISARTRDLISADLEISQELSVSPKGVSEPMTLLQVVAVGVPYGVSCKTAEDDPEPLAEPIKTEFSLIQEKHTDLSTIPCTLIALSQTGALLETEAELHPFDNIKMMAGGELFCKVIECREGAWMVRFTAKAPEFEAWWEQHKGERGQEL